MVRVKRLGFIILLFILSCTYVAALDDPDFHLNNILTQTKRNMREDKKVARDEQLKISRDNFRAIQKKAGDEANSLGQRIVGLSKGLSATLADPALESDIIRLQNLQRIATRDAAIADTVIKGLDKAIASGGAIDERLALKLSTPPSAIIKCGDQSSKPCTVTCNGGQLAPNTCSCSGNASTKSCLEQKASSENSRNQKKAEEKAKAAAAKRREARAGKSKPDPTDSRKPLPEKNQPFSNSAGNNLTPWQDSFGSPTQCSFNSGTKMSTKYQVNFKKCGQNKVKAEKICDANQNTGIKEAMNRLQSIARQMAQLTGKSLAATCDRYSVAMKKLEQSLYDYQAGCLPAKADCENTCMSSVNAGRSVSEVIANDAKCFSNSGPMIDSVMTDIKTAGTGVKSCLALQKSLDQAKSDAEELTKSVRTSNLCEKVVVEKCDLDSASGDCVDVDIRDVSALSRADTGNINAASASENGVNGSLNRNKNKTGSASGIFGVGSGGGNSFNNGEPRGQGPTGARGTSSKRSAIGGSFSTASSGDRGYESSASRKRRYKGNRYFFGNSSIPGKDKIKDGQTRNRNRELEKYLPGGKKDPTVKGGTIDGITGPLGPSIFEKVSARYRIHGPKMLQLLK